MTYQATGFDARTDREIQRRNDQADRDRKYGWDSSSPPVILRDGPQFDDDFHRAVARGASQEEIDALYAKFYGKMEV